MASRIFISYSRVHGDFIRDYVRLLRLAGQELFIDTSDIEVGGNWREVINSNIKICRLFFLFWCVHAKDSVEVEREWRLAQRSNRKIYPIFLCPESLPEELVEINGAVLEQTICFDCAGGATKVESRARGRQVISQPDGREASRKSGAGGLLALSRYLTRHEAIGSVEYDRQRRDKDPDGQRTDERQRENARRDREIGDFQEAAEIIERLQSGPYRAAFGSTTSILFRTGILRKEF